MEGFPPVPCRAASMVLPAFVKINVLSILVQRQPAEPLHLWSEWAGNDIYFPFRTSTSWPTKQILLFDKMNMRGYYCYFTKAGKSGELGQQRSISSRSFWSRKWKRVPRGGRMLLWRLICVRMCVCLGKEWSEGRRWNMHKNSAMKRYPGYLT